MSELVSWLKNRAQNGLLLWADHQSAAHRFGVSYRAVEKAALENGLLPGRYQRNRSMISLEDQLKLFRSRVAVIGCGGLGGFIIEELARLGVGQIVAVDPDVFEEHNLNRQLLATPEFLGLKKVAAAARRIDRLNPSVDLIPVAAAFGKANGKEILQGANVAVDGLDSIAVRLELSQVCREEGIPMVYGSIAGWYGYVGSQFPGEDTVEKIFSNSGTECGLEKKLGNPSFTPAVVASLEVAEVCKILLDRGTPARRRCLSIDLLDLEFVEIEC
ncbi:MAG: HesA/MoeB/ThiF family protein [Syntrophotaleaceae bacterium]